MLIAVAEQQLRDGQPGAAHGTGSAAVGVGERFDDADLIAAARHVQGRALIDQGDVVEGLKRLDETMLSVVADELSPAMTAFDVLQRDRYVPAGLCPRPRARMDVRVLTRL